MEKVYFENEEFKGIDYTNQFLLKGEYEECVFINCNLLKADLSDVNFGECKFVNCDISMATMNNTAFRDVKFKNCKLLGLHFDNCNDFLFTVSFEGCKLNLSSFYKRSLKRGVFTNCIMHEVDFTDSILTNSSFMNCDLLNAIFENTNLEKADLSTSFNFSIDPEFNRIKKAIFSKEGLIGLLRKYNIIIE